MGLVLALEFLEGGEQGLRLLDGQAVRSQAGHEGALSGDLSLAFADMPSDHREFVFLWVHSAIIADRRWPVPPT